MGKIMSEYTDENIKLVDNKVELKEEEIMKI